MKRPTLYQLVFTMHEQGRKELEAVARKLKTNPLDLVESVINHGTNSMYECMDSHAPISYKRAVFTAKIEEGKESEKPREFPKETAAEPFIYFARGEGLEDVVFGG